MCKSFFATAFHRLYLKKTVLQKKQMHSLIRIKINLICISLLIQTNIISLIGYPAKYYKIRYFMRILCTFYLFKVYYSTINNKVYLLNMHKEGKQTYIINTQRVKITILIFS